MNRLVETGVVDESDPAIELLRQTPATSAAPGLKRRVWASLQVREAHGAGRKRVSAVVAAALGLAIVALAGSAGAVIAGRWVLPALERSGPAASPRTGVPARNDRSHAARRLAERPAPIDVVEASAPIAPVPAEPETGRLGNPAAPARHVSVARGRAIARSTVVQERTVVLDALIALRRDRDAARAGALLEGYLAAHRPGALREEALALAIEAADARGDRPAAAGFAGDYEREFPGGRFHDYAGKHLGGGASEAAGRN